MNVGERIHQLLMERLESSHVVVDDESAQHVGHREGGSGGHYRVTVVSPHFAGLSRLEQHRMVYDALGDTFVKDVHALALTTLTPEQHQDS